MRESILADLLSFILFVTVKSITQLDTDLICIFIKVKKSEN